MFGLRLHLLLCLRCPFVITIFGSCSDSGSTLFALFLLEPSLVHSSHILPASAPHTASFHRSLLVGFSYRSCLHRFPLRRCFSSRASCTTHSNTHIVTNRIRKHVHGHQSQPYTNTVSIHEFFHRIVISCTHTNMSLWPSSPRSIPRLRFQKGVAVVVAKMCCTF